MKDVGTFYGHFVYFTMAYHARFRLFPDEGVPEDLRELAGTERQVGALSAESTDALLQRQQRLVDLGAFHAWRRQGQK
jgi:hypothetical protein